MLCYSDPDAYMVCFFHALGSLFAVDQSYLIRPTDSRTRDFVFKNLHNVNNKQTATCITDAICDNFLLKLQQVIIDSQSHYKEVV